MISLNYKYKAVLLAALLLLICPVCFQFGQMSGRKDVAWDVWANKERETYEP